ncbi:MAG: methyltransferase family protein [Chloroflexota bacterium]
MADIPGSLTATAEIPFWVTLGVWGIGERVLTFRDFRSGAWKGKQDAGSYFWVVAAVTGGFATAITLAAVHAFTLPVPAVWLGSGLVVAWAGMLLRLWAVLSLGRFFTTRVQVLADQRVVTSGPYRLVRHPSYLGLLILFFGLGLALGDLASAVVMIVLPAVGLVKRIAVEEAALRGGLGDSYIEYCGGRSRLIPGIW